MNITRQNYEELFLLYVDNELNIAQRKAVEAFVEENPDLRAELLLLQQSILPADEHIEFSNKGALLKTTSAPNPVNEINYEEYFVLYADDELTNEQKDQVEQFVYRNPQYQAAFESLQQAKLMPDTSVVFPDKYALYRTEEDDKAPVVRIRWWRMAAAAVLLLAGGMGWYMITKEANVQVKPGGEGQFANNDTPRAKQPVPIIQEQTPEAVAENKDNTPHQAPEVVTTTNKTVKDNRNSNRPLPKATAPVKTSQTDGIAIVDKKEEKNNDAQRNISIETNVPHKEVVEALKPRDINRTSLIDPTHHKAVDRAVGDRDLAAAAVIPTTTTKQVTDMDGPENPEVIYASNTDNRKNRMRGFFRKVSRVFDKATNADTDHEKSSIRIASFEIALK